MGSHILTAEIQEDFQYRSISGLVLTNQQSLTQKIKAYSDASARLADVKAHKRYHPNPFEEEKQAAHVYDAQFLDLLDAIHWTIERGDETLHDLAENSEFREVVASHLTAVIDQQHELNKQMAKATRENQKESILMKFYFNDILPVVAKGLVEVSPTDLASTPPATGGGEAIPGSEERTASWLGLMFRMWSWLFLHDFNPKDRMIERGEYMDNRHTVYIG